MTTRDTLEELLKIAEAATPGGYEAPNEWAVFTYTFHPTVAKALVKGMMVLRQIEMAAARNNGPLARDAVGDQLHTIATNAAGALADLATALKEGK